MKRPRWSRILVRLPNWVGDVVMATPALRAVRRAFPDAHVTGAVKAPLHDVLAGSGLVDELLVIEGREERLWRGAWSFARRLRAGRYEGVILLTNSLTSAIPLFLARIPRRVGYSGDGRRWLLTDSRAPDRVGRRRQPVPMPAYYQRVLDLLDVPAAGARYELPVRDVDLERARAGLRALGWDGRRPLLALNPGASFGSSKLWSLERLAAVGRGLRDRHGLQPLVLCGPRERALARELAGGIGGDVLDSSREPFDLATLRGCLQLTTLLVTTDTGPRHMAVALGRPVVVLMGPTDPDWTAWNLERTRVLRHPVPCGPCHKKVCPLDHACMLAISEEEVLAAAGSLLVDQPAAPSPLPKSF